MSYICKQRYDILNTEESKKPKNLGDCAVYEVNPFIDDLVNNPEIKACKKSLTRKEDVYHAGTGEQYKMPVVTNEAEYYWKDDRLYGRVFTEHLDTIKGLSSIAMQMFLFVIKQAKTNKDIVYIKPIPFIEFAGVKSRSQYYVAAFELVTKEIIAKAPTSGTFYLNPCVIYNGNISGLMPDAFNAYIKAQEAKSKDIMKDKLLKKAKP